MNDYPVHPSKAHLGENEGRNTNVVVGLLLLTICGYALWGTAALLAVAATVGVVLVVGGVIDARSTDGMKRWPDPSSG